MLHLYGGSHIGVGFVGEPGSQFRFRGVTGGNSHQKQRAPTTLEHKLLFSRPPDRHKLALTINGSVVSRESIHAQNYIKLSKFVLGQ